MDEPANKADAPVVTLFRKEGRYKARGYTIKDTLTGVVLDLRTVAQVLNAYHDMCERVKPLLEKPDSQIGRL